MCYLFTDGVLDQMNARNEKYMKHNFQKLLLEINGKPCAEQEKKYRKEMSSWMTSFNGNRVEQIDDMLLLALRIPLTNK